MQSMRTFDGIRLLAVTICAAVLLTNAVCQQRPEVGGRQQVATRLSGDLLNQLNGSLQDLAQKVSPAVVQIEVVGFGTAEEGYRRETRVVVRQHGIGSGVIVDPDGYIMTNAHVIEGAQRIRVILSLPPMAAAGVPPGLARVQVLNAKVIGVYKEADLALLKVDGKNLPTLHLRLDRPPQAGELVIAIGSAEGLQNSVTMGVISSAWRQPDPDNPMAYLQTDAPINPGNSGGPLVDVTGAVVGLNTFIFTNGGGNEGVGFAIPARIVDFVYQNLRKYGRVPRMEIGVFAQTITPTMAEGLGLAQDWGVVISDVLPNGPADVAGLKPGDVIVDINSQPVLGLTGFAAALYQQPAGDILKIDVLRGKESLSLSVPVLMARDRMDHLVDVADPVRCHIESLGILALDLDDNLRALLPDARSGTGVLVIGQAPGFSSISTGLQVADLIHALNGKPIASVEQLRSELSQLKPGDAAVLQIERRGHFQYLAFEME